MTIKLTALQPIVEDDRTMSKVFRTWALQVSEIEGGATGPAGPTGEGVPAGGIKSQHQR